MTRARDTYTDSGAFVLRAPLLPFRTLDELGDVRTLVADPVVREAIFLASPSLADDIDDEGATRALYSYLTRMAGRATPFGLFAGCAVGSVGGETNLTLPGREAARRHTRLDFGFLAKVVARLGEDEAVRPFLRLVPNTSLYRAGARLRMAEARVDERGVRYHRVTFEEDEALTATLERARDGASIEELAAALADDDITIEEAREYVGELVSAQLLVSDLGPVVTGDDSVKRIVASLSAHEETRPYADKLAAADAALDRLDERLGNDPAEYRGLAENLKELDPDLQLQRLFQVDLAYEAPALRLGSDVVNEAYRAIDLLHPLSRKPEGDELSSFKEAFTQRYEQREVPLAEALDEEIGIGFGPPAALQAEGAPLLAGLVPGGSREARGGPAWRGADTYLLRMLTRALAEGAGEIAVTKADLDALASGDPPPLPDALAVSGTICGDGRLAFHFAGGPSGARLLGRFCHLDPGIEKLVRTHVEAEEAARPDVVFAEVVHLPEGRVGNILARPVLREHEIPFLAVSGVEPARQISLDDLYVSVSRDRVVLRSRSLDREVVPRITNAHNHQTGALAVYRFLGALQYQGVAANMAWPWGVLSNAPYLPRVTHGRLVLALAQWNVTYDELKDLRDAKTPEARDAAIAALREALRLPRRVVISAGDNDLPVDLDAPAGRVLFAHEGRRGGLKLVELFPGVDDLGVSSPEGSYVHQFVLPLVRRTPSSQIPLYVGDDSGIESVFPPGSEWLTAKLYTGKATADAVLREVVAPLVAETRDAADLWFFLRYGDPEHHLRVRFHGDVLDKLHARVRPLLDDGRVSRVVLDTYRREVARYGGPEGIVVAEQVFRHDSDAVLAIVLAAAGDAGLGIRWRAAVLGVDGLLADGGMDVPSRRAAVRRWRDGLVAEQGGTGDNAKRHAGKLFRTEREGLARLMGGTPEDRAETAVLGALAARSEAIEPLLAGTREDILGSLCHMHVNRLLRGAQRTQELVVYDLLDRLYAAAQGRAGKG
ncbi:MAG TPA: lantibiotic dehydratase [Frankiaceae bacterium]|nr:lantibiotic dehydratase [Frankiaceae bacterium]